MSVPNQLATITTLRGKYPTPLGAQHAAFLMDVAQATGAKLLRKDAGSHVTLPTGVNVSQDILVFANGAECFDILSDGEGAAVPSWQPKGAIAGEYISVDALASVDPVAPAAPTLEARLTALEQRLAAVEATASTSVPPPAPASDLAADVKRIRALLELVAKRFGLQ